MIRDTVSKSAKSFNYQKLKMHLMIFSVNKTTNWSNVEFIQSLLSVRKKQLASRFNHTYSYIDILFDLKSKTRQRATLQPFTKITFLDREGRSTSIYDKHDNLNFHITNFRFLSSYIRSPSVYGILISHMIRYVRDISTYACFILRAIRFSRKLLKQDISLKAWNRQSGSMWSIRGSY